MDILLLGRKKDVYSKKLYFFLKKKNHNVDVIWSKDHRDLLKKKINKNYDLLISFRSYFILKKKHINLAKIAAINFHPGPPKYRGIGCINKALLNKEKMYGTTAHIINEKIDNGKIIGVELFKINKSYNLEKLLNHTHKVMLQQSKKILNDIFENPLILKDYFYKNRKIKWSKKIMTRKKLNDLYCINMKSKKTNIQNMVRALSYKEFKPYIKIENYKFKLE